MQNAGRSPQLDALAFYVATGIKTPSSPLASEPAGSTLAQQIQRGRDLFDVGQLRVVPRWRRLGVGAAEPAAGDTDDRARRRCARYCRTCCATSAPSTQRTPNQVKQNGTTAAGALGFNPPSLLGAFALAPYLHNGSAQTLDDVMKLKKHRTAGLPVGAPDPFDDPAKRADIVRFLESIDATTEPFAIP